MRVAMVSGGGRGLGSSIAERLADEGWKVSIGVRDPHAVADALAGNAERFHIAGFDATEPGSRRHLDAERDREVSGSSTR